MSESMFEGIIIALIVGAVVLLSMRSLYRTLRGKTPGCQCCGDEGCRERLDRLGNACTTEIFPLKRESGR